ncbi:O-antigen ligase family protein [Patescibacteria group bacterium]|nr:O-antigen ligase family protein [Patescibacteria group bacterium]
MVDKLKKINEYVIIGILVLMPSIIALIVCTDFVRSFEFAKTLILRLGILFVLFLALLKFLFEKKQKLNLNRFTSTPALFIYAMLFVIFLSTILSPQMLSTIWGSYERGIGLIQWLTFGIYFLLLLLFLDKKSLGKGITILIFTAMLVALYGILQSQGFDPIFKGYNTDFLEGRIFSTIGNPDFLAQFLAPVIALGIFLAWSQKKPLLIIPSTISLIALIQTESRASFLGLALGTLIFLLLITKNKKRLLAGLAALGLIFILLIQFNSPLISRFQLTDENFRSVHSRLLIWKAAGSLIADHPILGTGPDTFGIRFPEYLNKDFYYLEENLNLSADRSHNEILEMGTTGGLPLIALYILLGLWILRELIPPRDPKTLKTGLAIALTVYLIQNQFTFSSTVHFVLFYFLLAGLIIEKLPSKPVAITPSKFFRFLGVPILIFFLFFLYNETVKKPLTAELWYTLALSTDDTEQNLKNAIFYMPLESKYRYDLLMWFPNHTATELPSLRQIEGESLDVLGWTAVETARTDPKAAYPLFEQAIALNPAYPHLVRSYADALYLDHNFTQSAEKYEQFLTTVPDFYTWCPDLQSHSAYEQKKYRIFYKNVPDFNNSLLHLYQSYLWSDQTQKAEELAPLLRCHNLIK